MEIEKRKYPKAVTHIELGDVARRVNATATITIDRDNDGRAFSSLPLFLSSSSCPVLQTNFRDRTKDRQRSRRKPRKRERERERSPRRV